MSMSTMSSIFEIPEQSSTEYSDELMTALAAGRWWAIMEVSDPISEHEYGDLVSGQCWGTVEAGETSSPTSEKAQSQNSGFSDATRKTTKQWRQKTTHGAPFSARSTQGAPLVFSDASEKAQHSGFADATLKTTDQRRKWRQKKPQIPPVPAGSHQEPPVPVGSKQRGKLRIPENLTKHLQEASFETHMPAKSPQRAPVAAPKVLPCSPHEAPMPDKIADRPKLKIPEPLRSELLQQGAPVPARSEKGELTSSLVFSDASEKATDLGFSDATLKTTKQRRQKTQKAPVPVESQQSGKLRVPEHLTEDLQKAYFETPMPNKPLRAPVTAPKVLACSPHEAPMPDKITDRPKRKIPEPLRSELLQQKPQAPSLKIEPVCCGPVIDKISEWKYSVNPEQLSKELLRQRLQNAPVLVPASSLRIPRQQREKWEQRQRQLNIPQEVSVPAKTPQRALVPPCSLQQPPGSPQKRVCPWSTEASDNVGLCQAPPQKLCVEIENHLKLRSYHHQALQKTTSQLKRTQSSLQPRTQLSRKRALDSAGVDQSPPQKKQRMAIKVQDQQSDPDSIEQIDYLCSIFTKFV